MTDEVFTCICGQFARKPDGQYDVKCMNCGRVYNYRLQYLWKEDSLNELPGTGSYVEGPDAHGERRDEDQDTAIEHAFVQGTLPEEDRRDVPAPAPVWGEEAKAERPKAAPKTTKKRR